jgi:maleylacetate reductase
MSDTKETGSQRSATQEASTSSQPNWMPSAFRRTTLPGRIVFADGAIAAVSEELDRLNLRRAMLIAAEYDQALCEQGQAALGSRLSLTWTEVRQHVPSGLVARATEAASANNIDVLVTVGGGSTIGLGKAVAVNTGLPLVTVPTTYSGSEMTPIYGITTESNKKTARDNNALPAVVVYDPELLSTLPAAVLGPSGINALAHCAEALWAAQPDPITDALALDGARRLNRHLQAAYSSGVTGARGEVLIGSCLAGIALGTVGTSLHHSLCHLLGGLFDSPHAQTHAIVLPYVIQFVSPAVPLATDRLSTAMDTTTAELPRVIWTLARSVGTPTGLSSIGITHAQIGLAVDAALAQGLPSPRALERAGLTQLLEAAWHGLTPLVH